MDPLEIVLPEDCQLIANGISTAYHGVTYSWEPGLRGRESTVALKQAIATVLTGATWQRGRMVLPAGWEGPRSLTVAARRAVRGRRQAGAGVRGSGACRPNKPRGARGRAEP